MADRYDAVAVREYERNGETKTSFTRLGVAFPHRKGDGFTLLLDAMPAPTDGQFKIVLMPPRDRDERPTRQASQRAEDELDDEIPF